MNLKQQVHLAFDPGQFTWYEAVFTGFIVSKVFLLFATDEAFQFWGSSENTELIGVVYKLKLSEPNRGRA